MFILYGLIRLLLRTLFVFYTVIRSNRLYLVDSSLEDRLRLSPIYLIVFLRILLDFSVAIATLQVSWT